MSISMKALVLPLEKMDGVWGRVATAGIDGAPEAFTSVLEGLGANNCCEASVYQLEEVVSAWEEGDKEQTKIMIAELDLALAWSFAPVEYYPDSGKYASVVLEALIKVSTVADRDRITTAEWIAMFRSMTEERLAAMRAEITSFGGTWDSEIDEVLQGVRGVAKYCHEHGSEMAVCSFGDAIYQYPFSERAEMIYQKLTAAWK